MRLCATAPGKCGSIDALFGRLSDAVGGGRQVRQPAAPEQKAIVGASVIFRRWWALELFLTAAKHGGRQATARPFAPRHSQRILPMWLHSADMHSWRLQRGDYTSPDGRIELVI